MEYCEYYVNGRYYYSEIEAIEAIEAIISDCTYSLNGMPIEFSFKPIQYLPKHHNCRNCGAPVFGCKCDYCGTRY